MGKDIVLLAHNIRSLWNVGSFFRTADAFGVEKIYLTGYTGLPPRREISKTALGADEWIPWEHRDDPMEVIEELKKEVSAPIKKSERIVKDIDVHAAIEEARRLIGSNKIAEATSLIKEIQNMQRKIKADSSEKRTLSYDIMDLETDIKLAGL